MTICLLGASFDTGNLGVNALAESAIKILLRRWPDAKIVLLGSGYVPHEHRLRVGDREITLQTLPVRFCKNVLLPYHFLWFACRGVLARMLPWSGARKRVLTRNPFCRMLYEAELAVDITGGDSFSDIYGMRRFILGFLRKWLILLYGKRFVMLPQTYGPFRRRITRSMARHILGNAEAVYSRDREGLERVTELLNGRAASRVRFSPDVAFVLDPRAPKDPHIEPHGQLRGHGSIVVGLNISGLLYNGGYTRDNMFGLKTDYRQLIEDVAAELLKHPDTVLLLVPHVFPEAHMSVESDPVACRTVFDQLRVKYPGRVLLAAGQYDQNEIKQIIGRCDFFLGSRMHSCIAALSQGIPAVGLAYSKKFFGVFDTVGMGSWVVDLRASDRESILNAVAQAFDQRQAARESLERAIPGVQEQILGMFDKDA